MSTYEAPLADMRFVINELADLDGIARLPGFEDVSPDLVDAILEEAGKLGSEVLAPLNRSGDEEGCVLENGVVRTPKGFPEAYQKFIDGGWNGVPFDPQFGGQGLPALVATATFEIWHGANMAFALCPTLTQAAIELLSVHGSDALRSRFMEKLVSGVWTGTMNMTEPQAGSDLAKVRSKSVRDGDHYRITGQKIFITHGEHDFTDNIIHMVLARSPDGPEGIKGLSLFVVPKILVKDDGSLGDRNDLRCVSLEHKMGINASPTCVMSYGDNEGAIGYLVGEENRGIEYMFTMMNNARLAIGLEGVGIAEAASQHARSYAAERVQSRAVGLDDKESVTIDRHPDVKRMLLFMQAQTEAIRALAYYSAAALDMSKHHPDENVRQEKQALVDLLTPVVKAWGSDTGIDVANTGVQVFGGAGYIEESGAPQFLRDVRIAAIYEGTNGIQANDLIHRKVGREKGVTVKSLIADIRAFGEDIPDDNDDLAVIGQALGAGVDALEEATDWIVATYGDDIEAVSAGAVPYLRLLGITAGGWMMARAGARAAQRLAGNNPDEDRAFLEAKMVSARFFADHILVQAKGLCHTVTRGWSAVGRF
ncbi:MAG: acyl-CoA dehydrogenase [Proteobacteria bacterium]|nr:acyl-CoA dehydrogenase [Pseudomonadota bacterium]MDA1023929.1 acyl-CoA dehydrogenase [Pseudomonadota bacterium]